MKSFALNYSLKVMGKYPLYVGEQEIKACINKAENLLKEINADMSPRNPVKKLKFTLVEGDR